VKRVENGDDYERVIHEDIPSKKMPQSKEEGYVSVSVNGNASG